MQEDSKCNGRIYSQRAESCQKMKNAFTRGSIMLRNHVQTTNRFTVYVLEPSKKRENISRHAPELDCTVKLPV